MIVTTQNTSRYSSSNQESSNIVQTKSLESETKQNNELNSNYNETIEVENNDISYCLNKNVCDELKLQFLTSPWMPDKNYVFPTSTTSKKKLKFQFHWFERFPWLVYSTIDNGGALCKYCVIFDQEFGGKGNNQKLSSLVFNIFNNWKHAIEVFSENSKKKIFIKPTFYEVIIL